MIPNNVLKMIPLSLSIRKKEKGIAEIRKKIIKSDLKVYKKIGKVKTLTT